MVGTGGEGCRAGVGADGFTCGLGGVGTGTA
jgi:hypothetical protein